MCSSELNLDSHIPEDGKSGWNFLGYQIGKGDANSIYCSDFACFARGQPKQCYGVITNSAIFTQIDGRRFSWKKNNNKIETEIELSFAYFRMHPSIQLHEIMWVISTQRYSRHVQRTYTEYRVSQQSKPTLVVAEPQYFASKYEGFNLRNMAVVPIWIHIFRLRRDTRYFA